MRGSSNCSTTKDAQTFNAYFTVFIKKSEPSHAGGKVKCGFTIMLLFLIINLVYLQEYHELYVSNYLIL